MHADTFVSLQDPKILKNLATLRVYLLLAKAHKE